MSGDSVNNGNTTNERRALKIPTHFVIRSSVQYRGQFVTVKSDLGYAEVQEAEMKPPSSEDNLLKFCNLHSIFNIYVYILHSFSYDSIV